MHPSLFPAPQSFVRFPNNFHTILNCWQQQNTIVISQAGHSEDQNEFSPLQTEICGKIYIQVKYVCHLGDIFFYNSDTQNTQSVHLSTPVFAAVLE